MKIDCNNGKKKSDNQGNGMITMGMSRMCDSFSCHNPFFIFMVLVHSGVFILTVLSHKIAQLVCEDRLPLWEGKSEYKRANG